MDVDAIETSQATVDEVREIALGGDWTARMEHVGTDWKTSVDGLRSYRIDDPSSPPAWRICYHHDRTDMHMPADWSEERVKTTWDWYQRGENDGEKHGIKLGKNQVSNAVSMLRDLGIGTVLLPSTTEE
jgi:hypothetical protein